MMEIEERVSLKDVISPAFYAVHNDIKHNRHTYYDVFGGRGSTKSSFVSVEIVLGMMQDPDANAVVFHKYQIMLRDSVYSQIQWAIDTLGVSGYWRGSVSPMQFTYIPTGQKIIFRGLDKAQKTKSIKAAHGFFKYCWFEELDIFSGPEEIRMAEQSVLRGGHDYKVFKSFNPPIEKRNWANQYVLEPDDKAYRHKSDYRSVPQEWLGREFFERAEHLKQVNERAYRHEYLGEPVGLGTNVFEMLEEREITDEEISHMDTIYQGVDWGFYPDPYAFIRLYYDHNQEKVYLIDEIYSNRQGNYLTAEEIKRRGYDDYEVVCDSAEPKSIDDYKEFGIPARGAVKGPGSVQYGMKWLQVKTIVIDRARTPNAYREFTEYEFERNANGDIMSSYPDKNNHLIDATRYALERLCGRRGNHA